MHYVEPKVFLIGFSKLNYQGAYDWLSQNDVQNPSKLIGKTGIKFKTDAEMLIELAGRRCYKSFEVGLNPNVIKIREDIREYIENILRVGHGSVLEHISFTFGIENVSRVFTGEMNRHRAGTAISEGSMRYIRFEDIPFWIPDSIQIDESKYDEEQLRLEGAKIYTDLDKKKQITQDVFNEVFNYIQDRYQYLTELWKDELADSSTFKNKKNITSMLRRIIPMGVATGGVWTGNIRALRHIFDMRCDSAAEEEINLVANKMLEILIQCEPNIFGDFEKLSDGMYKAKYRKV